MQSTALNTWGGVGGRVEDIPSSSIRTKECSVACCRMADVSLSSTKKVLSPAQKHGAHVYTTKADVNLFVRRDFATLAHILQQKFAFN